MRNRYPGTCYRCGTRVEVGEGHFERRKGERMWRTQHAECAIAYRGTEDRGSRPISLIAAKDMAIERARREIGDG